MEFSDEAPVVADIPVPRFQELRSFKGDWPTLARRIDELKLNKSSAWLEILYEGDEAAGDLQRRLDGAVEGTSMEIVRIRNNRILERAMSGKAGEETLDDLNVTDVFERCLEAHSVSPERRPALLDAYKEIIVSLNEQDLRAE